MKPISKRGGAAVYSGDTHSAMLTDNGEIFIWGQSQGGRLGLDAPPEILHQPQILDTMMGVEVESIAMGAGHTVVLTTRYPADDTIGMTIATSVMDDGKQKPGTFSAQIFSECCCVQ